MNSDRRDLEDGGCRFCYAAASLASSESGGSKPTVPSGVAGVGRGNVSAPDGEQVCAAERDVLLWGDEPYVLSSLVDLSGLEASTLGMLGRGRPKNSGAGGEVTASTCTSLTCTAVIKEWRAMRRALRALGERASATESGTMEGRSPGRSPLSVRVLL